MKLKLLLTLILLLLLTPTIGLQAQSEDMFEDFMFICVEDTQPPPAGEEQLSVPPSLIGYSGVDVLGFIMSRQSQITVYAPENVIAATGLYNIAPDAISGGYRRTSRLGIIHTDLFVPAPRPCAAEYPDLIDEDRWMSFAIPASPEQAFLIQTGGNSALDDGQILGVVAFHAASPGGLRDFQIIQFSAEPIIMYLPDIITQERFTVIANKNVTIRRQYKEGDGFSDVSAPIVPDKLSILLSTLANETPPINLPETMRTAYFRIYPAFGMVIDYPPGGLFHIGMSSSPAERSFVGTGQRVRAIEGGFIAYTFTEFPHLLTPPSGLLEGNTSTSVVEVDDRGQLWVKSGSPNMIIEAWFVDIVKS